MANLTGQLSEMPRSMLNDQDQAQTKGPVQVVRRHSPQIRRWCPTDSRASFLQTMRRHAKSINAVPAQHTPNPLSPCAFYIDPRHADAREIVDFARLHSESPSTSLLSDVHHTIRANEGCFDVQHQESRPPTSCARHISTTHPPKYVFSRSADELVGALLRAQCPLPLPA